MSDLDPVLDLGFDPSEKATKPYLTALESQLDLYEFLGTRLGHGVAADSALTILRQQHERMRRELAREKAEPEPDQARVAKLVKDAATAEYSINAVASHDHEALRLASDAYRDVVGTCETVYVAPNFLSLAESATEGMPDFEFRTADLVMPWGFFYFARPVRMEFTSVFEDDILDEPDEIWVRAVLCFPVGDSPFEERRRTPVTEDTVMRMTFFIHRTDHRLQTADITAPFEGTDLEDYRWNSVFTHQVGKGVRVTSHPNQSLKFFMALNLLMEQKIGYNRVAEPNRPLRRRRDRLAPNMGDIIVAHLRRRVPRNGEHEEWDEAHEGPEWSHRWLVRGHWRNQWYPSENRHKPVYIMPFVKGPEDKPLIIKDRIASADR